MFLAPPAAAGEEAPGHRGDETTRGGAQVEDERGRGGAEPPEADRDPARDLPWMTHLTFDESVLLGALEARRAEPRPRREGRRVRSGKRSRVRTDVPRGRYVRSRPSGAFRDVALDATLRAAAARPRPVAGGPLRVAVRPADLHSKVRERKVGDLLIFLVDTSSSMGTEQRLLATQGAILALLMDAYQRRDRIGLLTFRETVAETILTPTSSVEKAKHAFERIYIGGTTPLSAGLLAAATLIEGERHRDPGLRPLLILITDGMLNIALARADPLAEALDLCRAIRARGTPAVVLDTEGGSLARSLESDSVGKGHEIAEALGARYLALGEVTDAAILDALRPRGPGVR